MVRDRLAVTAWDRVRGNKGGRTAGMDGAVPRYIPADDVTEMFAELRQQMKTGQSTPLPVRERRIPKANGKTRFAGSPDDDRPDHSGVFEGGAGADLRGRPGAAVGH